MNQRPNLLFLTNLYNGDAEEDLFLTKYLRKFFNVFIAHPLDVENLEQKFDAVLIRNIWPTYEFGKQKNELIRRLTKRGLLARSLAEQGYLKDKNYLEKQYLVDLFQQGYPVIPTVDKVSKIKELGASHSYFIKPKDREDGIGSAKLSLNELRKRRLKDYLFQPLIKFDYELCFYFIDGKFVYAFSTPNRLMHEGYKEYKPTKDDMKFAKQFVKWNQLEFGLQRIDAVREASSQKLLLTEVEDFGPYLYLQEMPERIQRKVLKSLVTSVFNHIKLHNNKR